MNNISGKWIPSSINSKFTKFWFAGFIDGDRRSEIGDGTF